MKNPSCKKLIALLLCAALMLAPMTGLGAFAAGTDEPVIINIPYFTRDDYIGKLRPEDNSVGTMSVDKDPLLDAAAQVRAGMVAHKPVIDVKIYDPYGEIDTTNIWDRVFDMLFIETGDPHEGDYLLNCWNGANGTTYIESNIIGLSYYFSYYITAEQEREFDAELERVMSSFDLDGMDDYHMLETAYNWICGNVTYDYEHLEDKEYGLQQTAYAALINHTSVCQGYAVLLYRMLEYLGIDCRYISGQGGGGAHAWNIVRLGDLYYNLDSTWDSGSGGYKNFLKCDANFADHTPDPKYRADDWNAKYPKSPADYVRPAAAVPVQGVKLNTDNVSLEVGSRYELTAATVPANASNQYFVWGVAGNYPQDVVRMDDGVLTALRPGTVPVYVRSVENNDSIAWCNVTVYGGGVYVPLDSVAASPKAVVLEEGDVASISVDFNPSNATEKSLDWVSGDTEVATVDSAGNITAVKEGVTTVAVIPAGNASASREISVKVVKPGYVAVDGLKYDGNLYIDKGSSVDISDKIIFAPANATDRELVWSSGNSAVASVDENGVVTGVTHGVANIVAALKNDPNVYVRIWTLVSGDDDDQYEVHGDVLVSDITEVNGHVTAVVSAAEAGEYTVYLASYDDGGNLIGVSSESYDLGSGETAAFTGETEPDSVRAVFYGWGSGGMEPKMDKLTAFEPYPEVMTSTLGQSRASFYRLRGETDAVVYTFKLKDNNSRDSGIMLGGQSILKPGSDNYFRDGSIVLLFAGGVIYTRDSNNKNPVAYYDANSYVDIRIEADIPANTYDLWVNNELAAGDVAFRTRSDVIDTMAIVENGGGARFKITDFEQQER